MELCKESAQNTLSICADECVEGMYCSLWDYHVNVSLLLSRPNV